MPVQKSTRVDLLIKVKAQNCWLYLSALLIAGLLSVVIIDGNKVIDRNGAVELIEHSDKRFVCASS